MEFDSLLIPQRITKLHNEYFYPFLFFIFLSHITYARLYILLIVIINERKLKYPLMDNFLC